MSEQAIAKELYALRREVGNVVVGYSDAVTDLLIGLLTQGHVLLEGVPGIAKTTLAKSFATASGLGFKRLQFTQDLLPADITGHWFFNQKTQEFEVREGPVFTNVLLADEINRAPPKTQSALLESMEERQVTIEGASFPLPSPFMVIATMNPVDVEGVYRLPEAQLDRFMLRSRMTYLPADLESDMLEGRLAGRRVDVPVQLSSSVPEAQAAVERVRVERPVIEYIRNVAAATREHPAVTLGASPRAMEHILLATRALALLSGRDFVIPDDVKHVTPKVLAHRLILDVDAEIEGKTAEVVLEEAFRTIEVPKGLEES